LSAEYGRGGAQTTRRQAGRPPPALPAPRNRCVAPGTIASSDGARSKGPRRRVDPKHDLVAANDDQQHRRVHLWQQPGCQVWPAAARDDRANLIVQLRRRPQHRCWRRSSRPAVRRASARMRPAHCRSEPLGEQADVEHVRAIYLLLGREQVEQQCSPADARERCGAPDRARVQVQGVPRQRRGDSRHAASRLNASHCRSRSELGAAPACRRSQPTPMHGGPDSLAAGSPSRSFNACSSSRENSNELRRMAVLEYDQLTDCHLGTPPTSR